LEFLKKRGFTLTELLAVIAIVGILSAIIIPSVTAVRRSSQKTLCSSNLRQVAQAYLMYFSDNKNKMGNESKNSDGTTTCIYSPLQRNLGYSLYLGAPDKAAHVDTEVSPLALTTEFKTKFALSPAKNNAYYSTTSYWNNPHVWTASSRSNSLYSASDVNGSVGPLEPARTSMLAVVDHDFLQAGDGSIYLWQWTPERFEYYGGVSTSLAFFDGHVESTSKDRLSARWGNGR